MLVEGDPVATGIVSARGQRIAWQEFGTGDRVLLMMPTWSIVHNDFWRHQVPWLAQRYRVLAFDGLGNEASDRPTDPKHYRAQRAARRRTRRVRRRRRTVLMLTRNLGHGVL